MLFVKVVKIVATISVYAFPTVMVTYWQNSHIYLHLSVIITKNLIAVLHHAAFFALIVFCIHRINIPKLSSSISIYYLKCNKINTNYNNQNRKVLNEFQQTKHSILHKRLRNTNIGWKAILFFFHCVVKWFSIPNNL